MKNKIFILLLSAGLLVSTGCSKKFLENTKDYDQYGETKVFSNETLAGQYIDQVYQEFFGSYNNPLQEVVGLYNANRSGLTEEIGGFSTVAGVSDYINPTKTLQSVTDADGYYGVSTSGSANYPYTRIRYCNDIIEKMNESITDNLSASFRATAKGQMYFLRAWQYFDLVRVYGGVPIVTTVQNSSTTDTTIQTPRAKSSECFAQIVKDLDSAAALLPMSWASASTDYGRLTAAGALAMKSRVLLTAASPLFNTDWDNSGDPKWQAALQASLDAETKLTAAGYGLYGASAKDWASMTTQGNSKFNKEALIVFQFSNTNTSSVGLNNSWENSLRPKDYGGSGNGISATKQMLDLFPMADGSRPTAANGYVDTFFFANRDPRFYRTFEFSGEKWGIKANANKSTWFYRWKPSATGNPVYYGNNQTNSPAIVRKMSDPAADSTGYAYSNTNIFEYRYAELILNIAECYAATGNINDAVAYLSKIRARVGIPSANNYGIGTPTTKYEAINDCLYERQVELAYEGKRFWDMQRWMLYDNTPKSGNSVTKLGLAPLNGTARNGYYWQAKNYTSTDPLTDSIRNSVLVDPDASTNDFSAQIAALENIYRNNFVMTPLDQAWDQVSGTPVDILFRPNYYLSGLNSSVLSIDPWITQTEGWLDYSGGAGTFDYQL